MKPNDFYGLPPVDEFDDWNDSFINDDRKMREWSKGPKKKKVKRDLKGYEKW